MGSKLFHVGGRTDMKPTVTFHNFVNTLKNNSAIIYHGLHTILIPTKHTELILVDYILVQNHHTAGDS